MVTFCLEAIEVLITNGDINSYPLIKQYIEKYGLKMKSSEELIDVCLLALTIISYSIIKRSDLIANVDLKML